MPPLGVDFASAANALVAAHLAPVTPQGEIQTLGEHGLLWPRVRPTRAPRGALWHTHRTCEHEAYGSDLTPLVRLPLRPNGARTAPILLRSRPPSTTKSFLPAKVVLAGHC